MAKVVDNLMTEGLSGAVSRTSKFTFRRSYGKTFLVKKSIPRKEYSVNQLEIQSKFKAAVSTARSLMINYPENVELIEKRLPGMKYSTVMGYLVACSYKNSYPDWIIRN